MDDARVAVADRYGRGAVELRAADRVGGRRRRPASELTFVVRAPTHDRRVFCDERAGVAGAAHERLRVLDVRAVPHRDEPEARRQRPASCVGDVVRELDAAAIAPAQDLVGGGRARVVEAAAKVRCGPRGNGREACPRPRVVLPQLLLRVAAPALHVSGGGRRAGVRHARRDRRDGLQRDPDQRRLEHRRARVARDLSLVVGAPAVQLSTRDRARVLATHRDLVDAGELGRDGPHLARRGADPEPAFPRLAPTSRGLVADEGTRVAFGGTLGDGEDGRAPVARVARRVRAAVARASFSRDRRLRHPLGQSLAALVDPEQRVARDGDGREHGERATTRAHRPSLSAGPRDRARCRARVPPRP